MNKKTIEKGYTMIYKRFFTEEWDENGVLQGAKLSYPENFNFAYDVLDVLADEHPDKLALLWRNEKGAECRFSFGELKERSNQAANLFQSWGLKKGDVLSVCLKTHYEYWYIALGAHKLGLVLSPLFHLLSVEDLSYRLSKSRAKAVICTRDGDAAIRMGLAVQEVNRGAEEPVLTKLYTVQGAEQGFADFTAALEASPTNWTRIETRAEEPCLLYFTSGTTGKPKGVLHDHAFTLGTVMGARYMQDNGPDSLHFATGNTAWEVVCGTKFYGQWFCESAIFVYDYDRFDPHQVLRHLSDVKVTSIMAQPAVYRQMTDAGMDQYDLSSITCYAVGGEKLTQDLAETVKRQTGQRMYEGYAQSEAGLITANSKNMGYKEGSVGKALPKYRVEIRKEDGTFGGPMEQGEIVLLAKDGKHPVGLVRSYFEDPEATAKIWDGTIFCTHDIGYRDEEGFFFYLGRADGLIKTKGYRVSPFEIENVLTRHPAVYECMVVGEPDRDLGQRIVAYVRLVEGYRPGRQLEDELLRFHNEGCSSYKKLRELHFVKQFQRNQNGKVIRDQFSK